MKKDKKKSLEEFQPSTNINDKIRKAYYKEWRKNNKDKIKQYNDRFWKKQAQKLNNKEQ